MSKIVALRDGFTTATIAKVDQMRSAAADLWSLFDAIAKVRGSRLDLFESMQPLAAQALLAWALGRGLSVESDERGPTELAGLFVVYRVALDEQGHHDWRIAVFAEAK